MSLPPSPWKDFLADFVLAAAFIVVAAVLRSQTLETTFVSIWSGTDNLLQIDPYVVAQVGDALWAWG